MDMLYNTDTVFRTPEHSDIFLVYIVYLSLLQL